MRRILCRMTDSGSVLDFRALTSVRERMRGLLGTDRSTEGVVLCGCSSIHTWGMGYALDVAFVSRRGEVLKSARAVPPRRLISAAGAYYVFERPASFDAWPSVGSWVSIAQKEQLTCEQLSLANS